ncbi:hypothetical protein JQ581_28000 [Bradyrhizobium liaoningense]|uniref:hypothetical protein n=1 Tax=Bradyrhizobium liaoningense TaxID=43992 RepID=UPI001BAD019A|nr:hypothetical protein [Bradyrhizobium liaoningense]MBR0740783.1 hypothetical protein [Bradyrhizobium liaoningense]
MGDIIRLVPKSELERLRLIREARAIYDSIFPPTVLAGEQPLGSKRSTQGASDSIRKSTREGD